MRVEPSRPARIARSCPSPIRLIALLIISLAGASVRANATQVPGACQQKDAPTAEQPLSAIKLLARQGRYSEAEPKLREFLRGHDNCAEAHALLGLVKYQLDRPADSLAEFSRAARIVPPCADELVVVALDYLKLKDLLNADKWMTAALEKAPANASAWRYLGGIKYAENRFSEAIDAYTRCLSLRADEVLAQDGLGRSYEGLNENEKAAEAYRHAIDMQSRGRTKHAEPLLHLGTLLLHQGHADRALPLLNSAEHSDPHNAEIHQQLGEAYTQLKQFEKAQAELEKAIELSPQDAHLHWLLAGVYRKEGQTAKAEKEGREFASRLRSPSGDKVQ